MWLLYDISVSFQEAGLNLNFHLVRGKKPKKPHFAPSHSSRFTVGMLCRFVASKLLWSSEVKPTSYTQRDFQEQLRPSQELLCVIKQDASAELLMPQSCPSFHASVAPRCWSCRPPLTTDSTGWHTGQVTWVKSLGISPWSHKTFSLDL